MSVLRRVPVAIVLLFAMDVALALAPVVDYSIGSPFTKLRHIIDLDAEATLPTWYSSMQWFCAGGLFALFAIHAWRSRLRGMVAVSILALTCLAFSADEIVGIHEWLGFESDALLAGGSRADTALWNTGLWPFLLGIPVIAVLAVVVARMRHIFMPGPTFRSARARELSGTVPLPAPSRGAPHALALLVVGLAVMFSGALGVELLANLIEIRPGNRGLLLAQVVAEEFMEMLGVTFIVWSAHDLLRAYGFGLQMPETLRATRATKATAPVSRGFDSAAAKSATPLQYQ